MKCHRHRPPHRNRVGTKALFAKDTAAAAQTAMDTRLPRAIRSDHGVPFASPTGRFNLSKLSVSWLRLGTSIERITWSSAAERSPFEVR